jgi:hypothetical protein
VVQHYIGGLQLTFAIGYHLFEVMDLQILVLNNTIKNTYPLQVFNYGDRLGPTKANTIF